MNFNLGDLERLFDDIKEIINFIEISQYQNRRHRIFLGNGDRLNFSIPNDTISHLLGINTNYLISTGRFNSTNSFEVLKEMCENPYRINQLYNDGIIKYENLFSPFIINKLEGFRENIKINIEETEMVCKYNSSRTFISEENTQKYDYIIIKKYQDGKIGILGLVNKESYYVPMSNQLFASFEEAKETLDSYIKNQEVSIITGVNVFNTETDFDKTYYLSLNNKINKIKNIKECKKIFNCSLDLSGDYEYTISRLVQNRTDYYEDNDLIDIIVNSIKEGKLIDTNVFRDTNLSKIIETFNDYLCETQIGRNSSVSESYTQMKKDLEHLRNKLTEANEKISVLTEKNGDLTELAKNLTKENTEYKDSEEKILQILNRKPRI